MVQYVLIPIGIMRKANKKANRMKKDAETAASSDGQTANGGAGKPQRSYFTDTTSHAENNNLWVSPNSVNSPEDNLSWFYMRASYGRERKAYAYLMTKGIEAYCPQMEIETENNGQRTTTTQSIIPNSLFVRSSQNEMKKYIGRFPLDYLHHYYSRFEGNRKPIIIPDYQMTMFMQWADANSSDKFFREQPYVFNEGQTVRVTKGTFEGFTGKVVTIKGYKRIGVNIDNVGFIATSYIPRSFLEIVPEESNNS